MEVSKSKSKITFYQPSFRCQKQNRERKKSTKFSGRELKLMKFSKEFYIVSDKLKYITRKFYSFQTSFENSAAFDRTLMLLMITRK